MKLSITQLANRTGMLNNFGSYIQNAEKRQAIQQANVRTHGNQKLNKAFKSQTQSKQASMLRD